MNLEKKKDTLWVRGCIKMEFTKELAEEQPKNG